MKLYPVQSTAIAMVGFSTSVNDAFPLVVVFTDRPNKRRPIHRRTYYYQATRADYRAIVRAESVGRELRARVDYNRFKQPNTQG